MSAENPTSSITLWEKKLWKPELKPINPLYYDLVVTAGSKHEERIDNRNVPEDEKVPASEVTITRKGHHDRITLHPEQGLLPGTWEPCAKIGEEIPGKYGPEIEGHSESVNFECDHCGHECPGQVTRGPGDLYTEYIHPDTGSVFKPEDDRGFRYLDNVDLARLAWDTQSESLSHKPQLQLGRKAVIFWGGGANLEPADRQKQVQEFVNNTPALADRDGNPMRVHGRKLLSGESVPKWLIATGAI